MIRLRGHHLLCLLGYRGMGYSPEYVENMTQIHRALRNAPDTTVLLVSGSDDLCDRFPTSQPSHCNESRVHARDNAVIGKLHLGVGQPATWAEIQQRIKESVEPSDITTLCSTCSWRSYGVCEEGIRSIRDGHGLPVVD